MICKKCGITFGNKFIKVVSTARGYGGCARSIITIMKYLLAAGHNVEFIPFRNCVGSHEFRDCLSSTLKDVNVTLDYNSLRESCDVLFIYTDDYVWEFNKPEIAEIFSNINAEKKIMMINYRRGGIGEIPWTKGWDKYMFLNSTQEEEFRNIYCSQGGGSSHCDVNTKVLPPCIELNYFLKVQPNYNDSLRLVRHSSQGDTKFSKEFNSEVLNMLEARNDLAMEFLPGPSSLLENDRIRRHHRTDKAEVIAYFLSQGNLFWYSLPQGYMDAGPRVIIEAMAAGLPILADNWGGAVDRVTPECGWLCDSKDQFVDIIKNVSFEELKKKGEAARERAVKEFTPEAYIKEILE